MFKLSETFLNVVLAIKSSFIIARQELTGFNKIGGRGGDNYSREKFNCNINAGDDRSIALVVM